MKKYVLLMAVVLLAAVEIGADAAERLSVTGHTFFSVRPQYYTCLPIKESFFQKQLLDASEDGCGCTFEVVPFGGRTTNPKRLAGFFTPGGKCCLNVLEAKDTVPSSLVDGLPDKDIEARHFNIETASTTNTFRSRICFNPRQTYAGVGLSYRQCISCSDHNRAKFWVELSAPVINVKNRMGLCEEIIDNGGGPVAAAGLDNAPRVGNMTAAFKQGSWLFGRIDDVCDGMSKTGLGDIEAMLGLNWQMTNCCFLSWYVGAVFPTGNKPNGRYVFEPIVGNNHHFGVMYGSTFEYDFWSCGDHELVMRWDANSRYLFRNHQVRSLDLLNQPWSRYMEMYANTNQAGEAFANLDPDSGTSGINLMTQCVKVFPRFNATMTTALSYRCRCWLVEAGYNFFARQAEKVELANQWVTNPALKSLAGAGTTTVARTIKNNFQDCFFDFADYHPFTVCDIDLESAAHPAVLSNLIYATAGYNWYECCYPTTLAIGGSYEFGDTNAQLERWTVWGKFVVAF